MTLTPNCTPDPIYSSFQVYRYPETCFILMERTAFHRFTFAAQASRPPFSRRPISRPSKVGIEVLPSGKPPGPRFCGILETRRVPFRLLLRSYVLYKYPGHCGCRPVIPVLFRPQQRHYNFHIPADISICLANSPLRR